MNMIYWPAVGAFAVGTEAFMISAILPGISSDLKVSVQSVGHLVHVSGLRTRCHGRVNYFEPRHR
jgi:predicted MFS family arabinose efflux permease